MGGKKRKYKSRNRKLRTITNSRVTQKTLRAKICSWPHRMTVFWKKWKKRLQQILFLAAKFRKQNSYSAQSRLQSTDFDNSPDIGDNRNPFKKNNLTPQSGAIRSGLVFDGMSNKPGTAKSTQSNHSTFGSRPPVRVA